MNDFESLARWMIRRGFATGHATNTDDLIAELDWQIEERNLRIVELKARVARLEMESA